MELDQEERFDLTRDNQDVFAVLWRYLEKGRKELETLSSLSDEDMYEMQEVN